MRETHYQEYKNVIYRYILYKNIYINKQEYVNISIFLVLNCG